MIASLPWYDLPSVQWANDVIWRATGLPGKLDRTMAPVDQWRANDLAVTNACGLDLFLTNAPIEPVLAPVFELPDCDAGCYYSYLIGQPDGRVAAVNSMSSRSGMSALLTVALPETFVVTGSHTASIDAVQRGLADLACIDAVTWHILERDEPSRLVGLRIRERTAAAPAPPYVVRKGARDVVEPLTAAMVDPSTLEARRALLLRGVKAVTIDDYTPISEEYARIRGLIPPSTPLRPSNV